MSSYMVPHQLRGAQRERASIYHVHARKAYVSLFARAQCSRALLAHVAQACVKCSRACALVISTGNVSYVLKK